MQAQKAEGTRDLIGAEMRAWQKMQQIAAGVFEPFGFKPIETPAIEQVDVFVHGIGQSTDVVRKEMFRVFSGANLERVFTEGTDTKLKPKQRLALRPEGTAGVVRAVVENNLVPQGSTPFKAYYAEAMFRGERPQKGRLRQFHQVGIEWLGAPDPAADAECIIMLMEFYKRLASICPSSVCSLTRWAMPDAVRPIASRLSSSFSTTPMRCATSAASAPSLTRCAPSTARTTTAARSWPTPR